MPTTETQYAHVEARRGRPLTLAERNIDIAGLNKDLADGKEKIRQAVADAQAQAIRTWQRRGQRGRIRIKATPELARVIEELYAAGHRHGQAELRKAGYSGYAATPSPRRRKALMEKLNTMLAGVSARVTKAAGGLDMAAMTARGIAESLGKVPGALDVASRMTSPATYAGLGDAFDAAKGQVDAEPGTGGNGWEYTSVMDGGTCGPCVEADGTTYDTWDEAQQDLPDGGPNPDCEGESRCRCRLAPRPL